MVAGNSNTHGTVGCFLLCIRLTFRVHPIRFLRAHGLGRELADKLDEVTSGSDPAAHSKLIEEAKAIMQRYETYLAGAPVIAALDTNPFMPVAIRQTLSTTLTALVRAFH
jgi:hypothetical protein